MYKCPKCLNNNTVGVNEEVSEEKGECYGECIKCGYTRPIRYFIEMQYFGGYKYENKNIINRN